MWAEGEQTAARRSDWVRDPDLNVLSLAPLSTPMSGSTPWAMFLGGRHLPEGSTCVATDPLYTDNHGNSMDNTCSYSLSPALSGAGGELKGP